MKRIPILNANREILCDDEDYEMLSSYKWRIYPRTGGGWEVRAFIRQEQTNSSPVRLIYGQDLRTYRTIFRDGNICNCQKQNIRILTGDNVKRIRKSIKAKHCPFGPATLGPKPKDGRSIDCYVCSLELYDYYYICLDKASHLTCWKGWLRYGEHDLHRISPQKIQQVLRYLDSEES